MYAESNFFHKTSIDLEIVAEPAETLMARKINATAAVT
jgi:hypothetical protein